MKYIKLMRVHHYIKNFLIFLPIFFSGSLFNLHMAVGVMLGWLSFSCLASVVYIVNDLSDVNEDRLHPTKCKRPIASGAISKRQAVFLLILLSLISIILNYLIGGTNWKIWGVYVIYIVINVLYSVGGMKNVPLLDVILLVSGFFIRVLYGSVLTGISISDWLYLVIVFGAFYLGFGKRRNEINVQKKTRTVLQYYNVNFLDKSMYSCMTLAVVFFSMWCIEKNEAGSSGQLNFLVLVPVLMIILLKYSLNIEGESDGDPMNVILKDKVLIILSVFLGMLMFYGLYF